MGMHSEKHHLPAGAWAPLHGQLVAEEPVCGGTWLRVCRQHPGQQQPMGAELASSSACHPGRAVALCWGGSDGPQRAAGLVIHEPRLWGWHWWKTGGTGKGGAGHCWWSQQPLAVKVFYGLHGVRATLLNVISSQSIRVSYS